MYTIKQEYVEKTDGMEFSEIMEFMDARNALWESEDEKSIGQQYAAAKAIMETAADPKDVARAKGTISGVIRRYRHWMLMELTILAFKDVDTSREFIRKWQKDVFGKSVAWKKLATFADKSRIGAGRKSLSTASAFRRTIAAVLYGSLVKRFESVDAEGDFMARYEMLVADHFKERHLPSGEASRPHRAGL